MTGGDARCKEAGRSHAGGDWRYKHAYRVRVGGDCQYKNILRPEIEQGRRSDSSEARRAAHLPRIDDAGVGLTVGDRRYKDAVDVMTGGDGPCKLRSCRLVYSGTGERPVNLSPAAVPPFMSENGQKSRRTCAIVLS